MFKKSLAVISVVSLLGLNIIPAIADCMENCDKIEHLDVHKKAPCNEVVIQNLTKTVKEGNVLVLQFDEKFYSKEHQAGEVVNFVVPQALYTREGTLILPIGTKIVADVIDIQKPKKFNKNARVDLLFKTIVLPDQTCIDIKAKPFTKDSQLKEGPWMTAGKLFLSTITMGLVGAGASVGFAFIPKTLHLGTAFAIGIPVGCTVGLVTGLITPGLHYRAKKGEQVYILLIDEFCVGGTPAPKSASEQQNTFELISLEEQ